MNEYILRFCKGRIVYVKIIGEVILIKNKEFNQVTVDYSNFNLSLQDKQYLEKGLNFGLKKSDAFSSISVKLKLIEVLEPDILPEDYFFAGFNFVLAFFGETPWPWEPFYNTHLKRINVEKILSS